MKLIFFSPVSWDSFTQRPHEFVYFFQKKLNCQVMWVEPHPTRLPKLVDVYRRTSSDKPSSRETPKWLTIIKPNTLPIEPLPIIRALNFYVFEDVIDKLRGCAKEDFFVIGKPSLLAKNVLQHFNPVISLYDAMDDFPQFYHGISRKHMARQERDIAAIVKHISTSSRDLVDKFGSYKPHLVFNACSETISNNMSALSKPSDIRALYVGTIGAWFDWDFVKTLAESNPQIVFDIVGPLFQPPPLKLSANINLKPAVSHIRALELIQQSHIGLIPFKINNLTKGVDPIKYYEYKMFGLSIVSSGFGEMRHRINEPGVYIIDASKKPLTDLSQLSKTDHTKVPFWRDRFLPLFESIFGPAA